MDKDVRKGHYAAEVGVRGRLSVSNPSAFALCICLELVRSSAGRGSRRPSGMRVRPLRLHFIAARSPIRLQPDFNFISPCNTTLTAKELEMHYQPCLKAWIASLINKIIIRVVIPLNRSFCKYLNPINKVFSEGAQQTLAFAGVDML